MVVKKGISATVIGLILLVIALAIIMTLLIWSGKKGEEEVVNMVSFLNIIRHGGH